MIIKEGSSQEYVLIDDIDYIKPTDNNSFSYDICYLVRINFYKRKIVNK